MPNELKPCPFCGVELVAKDEFGRNPITEHVAKNTVYWHPERNCILDFYRFHFYAQPWKEEQWNRRADNA